MMSQRAAPLSVRALALALLLLLVTLACFETGSVDAKHKGKGKGGKKKKASPPPRKKGSGQVYVNPVQNCGDGKYNLTVPSWDGSGKLYYYCQNCDTPCKSCGYNNDVTNCNTCKDENPVWANYKCSAACNIQYCLECTPSPSGDGTTMCSKCTAGYYTQGGSMAFFCTKA